MIAPLLEDDTRLLNRQLERRVFSREAMVALQEPIVVICIAVYLYVAVVVQEMPITSTLVLVFLLLLGGVMFLAGSIIMCFDCSNRDTACLTTPPEVPMGLWWWWF